MFTSLCSTRVYQQGVQHNRSLILRHRPPYYSYNVGRIFRTTTMPTPDFYQTFLDTEHTTGTLPDVCRNMMYSYKNIGVHASGRTPPKRPPRKFRDMIRSEQRAIASDYARQYCLTQHPFISLDYIVYISDEPITRDPYHVHSNDYTPFHGPNDTYCSNAAETCHILLMITDQAYISMCDSDQHYWYSTICGFINTRKVVDYRSFIYIDHHDRNRKSAHRYLTLGLYVSCIDTYDIYTDPYRMYHSAVKSLPKIYLEECVKTYLRYWSNNGLMQMSRFTLFISYYLRYATTRSFRSLHMGGDKYRFYFLYGEGCLPSCREYGLLREFLSEDESSLRHDLDILYSKEGEELDDDDLYQLKYVVFLFNNALLNLI